MRLSNKHYSGELRAFALARRMLGHQARPHTVCLWTRLSDDRVQSLSRIHRREVHDRGPTRHGPSPTKLSGVLTSPSLRSEAAALAGVCRHLKVIPKDPLANASSTLPSVERGERLCSAHELFRRLIPHARLSLEELGLLMVSLAEGAEWGLERCASCSALMVVDRLGLDRCVCEDCQRETRRTAGREAGALEDSVHSHAEKPVESEQLELFSDGPTHDSNREQAKEPLVESQQRNTTDRGRKERKERRVKRRRSG